MGIRIGLNNHDVLLCYALYISIFYFLRIFVFLCLIPTHIVSSNEQINISPIFSLLNKDSVDNNIVFFDFLASYRYCSKHYGKVLDECNRVCDCRYGYITDCRRVRKEANLMPLKERERFVQTYLTLTTKQPYKARYEEFIKIHSR